MSLPSHEKAVPGKGMKDIGQLGTWLGLIAFTFMFATFIASNVYLRGWSPGTFSMKLPGYVQNMVNTSVIFTVLTGILSLGVGISYKKRKDVTFITLFLVNGCAFLTNLILTGYLIAQYKTIGPAAWTAYGMVEIFMFALELVSVAFSITGFIYILGNNTKALNRFVPAAMSVWIYTVLMGIIVFIQCDLIQIGQFAEWCGLKAPQ